MDKKNFLKNFSQEDKGLAIKVYEDIELCNNINYQVYENIFLPPHIWNKLSTLPKSLGIEVYTKGLNSHSEKRTLLFNPIGQELYSYNYPIRYFKISGDSRFKELEHRHFLASIMSLGIKREKLGDLIVREGICYGVIIEELYDFLKDNLNTIGKLSVKVEDCQEEEVPSSEFLDEVHLISSLRLDNLVTSITKGSRTNSASLIKEGLVVLNYNITRKNDQNIMVGDLISIRKYGKYQVFDILGESKKGKTRLLLKKYI